MNEQSNRAFYYCAIQAKQLERRAFWMLFPLIIGGCFLLFSAQWFVLPFIILFLFLLLGFSLHSELDYLKKEYSKLIITNYKKVSISAEKSYN